MASDDPAAETTSLRARQRIRVRRDIYRAAVALFVEHGFTAVTTDEIAAAAGVSPSTYFRHVTSKEELLLDPMLISGESIATHFADRPADESTGHALAQAICERSTDIEDAELQQWRAAILTAPELIARVTLISPGDRVRLVLIASRRMKLDPSHDLRPGLLVHLMLAAAEYAFQLWINPEADRPLIHYITTALAHVTDTMK
ncbi:TetR family transcriptional regulator [Mycobacteroides abscessus subsp. abscessus]|uniref:TetR/AcrR family transcriptional regulator n=1 Tax=Mycobacteroides abscessus TaxID=36809 RepID=UPI00092BB81C|nr:TetR/AcrR family transcriptional regulator [Mycobacteroides abscessus]SHT51130.1 TetR family transcriptional regulator [Mycobacteroides abscessus subsp. abscessus]SHT55436.1 TetR family transcriptional regulator [Mycobacteroides abscessus subsp. abscessus]SHT57981.1 TetR family transcriptional regulator [Mycobacteroides abscessus subsp. abscessus]SHX51672.1 TetR family transcriptional regulator [Mycobacteroides abscessus subsp. abscessus]SIB59411.1 TetR family transcriptional regulator [Myc